MVATKSVTGTGPTRILAVSTAQPGTTRCTWATIQAKSTNTGIISIRAPFSSSDVGNELINPGDSIVLWAPASLHLAIDLAEVFMDPAVGGEGVNVTYVR